MAIRKYLAKITAIRRKEDLRNCKFFLENYGKFQVWSGMYPAYWWHTIFFLLVLILHDGFLAYTAFIGMEDLALFAESTHFVIMIGIMILGVLNISIYKKNNEEIFWSLERGLHNYQDTVDEESQKEIKQFREEADARKKLYSKVIAYTMYSACIVLSAVRPMFEYLSGKYDNPKYDDGISRRMPVACWLPYDTSQWHFHFLALLSEYYIITLGTCAVIGNDVVFLRLAEELVYELKVMTLLLQNIRKRTEFVMEKKLKMVPRNLDKNLAWTYSVRLCLSHSIQHHITFNKVFTYLSEMMYYLLFFLLFGSVYLLCLCGVLFTSDNVEFAPKFTFAVFMGGELVNTFLFCWYGQQIQDMSGELRDVIYNTDWFEYSTAVKYHYLMMQMRCLNELKLSAGGFMNVSLSTFGNVLNSAYSYFNLFQASRQIN